MFTDFLPGAKVLDKFTALSTEFFALLRACSQFAEKTVSPPFFDGKVASFTSSELDKKMGLFSLVCGEACKSGGFVPGSR